MRRIMKFVMFGVLAVLFVFLFGFVVEWLWNWLMPALFSLHKITYWQAFGILILCRILFGGFRGARPGGSGSWRRRMRERWEHMTPEEREKFRQTMSSRWCPPGPAATP